MSSSIPPRIPDLDDNQPLPFGDDDDFEIEFDGTDLVFRSTSQNDSVSISPTLDMDIPGNISSSGLIATNTVPGGETLTIPSGESMVVAGDYTVNGTLDVNGTFFTFGGSIKGSGSITGSGQVFAND